MTETYVRTEMLPEQDPPSSAIGIVRWARENLFSGPLNTFLTLASLAFLYFVVSHIWPWLSRSVWNAGSLTECREIITATYAHLATDDHGVTGACFAVIKDRWHQLLFGFYPQELYWRPVLAFVLMLVALAPVLFPAIPRKMLWFTGIYPALAFWLFWGGTVFMPVLILFGFVLGYFVVKYLSRYSPLIATILAIIVPIVWWLFLLAPTLGGINSLLADVKRDGYIERQGERIALYEQQIADESIDEDEKSRLESRLRESRAFLENATALPDIKSLFIELETTAEELRSALPASVIDIDEIDDIPADVSSEDRALLGEAITAEEEVAGLDSVITIVEREVGRIGLRPVASDEFGGFMLSMIIGVSGIVFSLPLGILLALGRQSNLFLIRTICIGFIEFIRGVPLITLLFTASLLLNYFLPPGTNFDIILRVIIMVTLFAAAYMAEVIRGGLAALPRGQYEAADALGLDYWKAQRLIIMPQALKISIPGIVSTFIGLFKDTVLVVFIGLLDPLGLASAIRASTDWNGIYWELFIFIGALFWVVCFGMSRYSMYLENRLKTTH